MSPYSERMEGYKRCACHASAGGHYFGADLRCWNAGCEQSWEAQQDEPTECSSLKKWERPTEIIESPLLCAETPNGGAEVTAGCEGTAPVVTTPGEAADVG
jgi:hypothetical protein